MKMKTQENRIAAIFDVDGTLLAGSSMEWTFARFLFRRGELGWREGVHFLAGGLEAMVHGRSPFISNKSYLRGKDATRIRRLARDCFASEIAPRLLPAAMARLRWHQDAGHFVMLLSGSLDLLLEPLAEHLGLGARIGAEIESEGRRLTGRIIGVHPLGEAKAECLRIMTAALCFNLKRSFAYADQYADRSLLRMVGNPVVVNGDAALRRYGRNRGWMSEDFAVTASRSGLRRAETDISCKSHGKA
ncbi:MAG: HAD-IB family hydrolase [Blastocatellia bacterium]|nr:HAD-IB family hydrolase [Blastocatellia bacterium]